MADVTGALHYDFNGQNLTLRLTWGVLAKLQGRHGNDLGGLLSGQEGGIPNFGVMIDLVSQALQKGMKMAEAEAYDLADDVLTADASLAGRLLEVAFPDQGTAAGNGQGKPRRR